MIPHVDDLFVGCLKVQDVYRELADAFEMKCTYAGPKLGNSEAEYFLWRTVFIENGLEIHGDPTHAVILFEETGMEMCKSVNSLHVVDAKLLETLADDTRSYMPPSDARRYRSAVARVVPMAQDRPDLDVVACTLTNTMAHPKIGDDWLVKGVFGYIKSRPQYAQSCEYQGEAQELVVQTDSNRVSCKVNRQSYSGGLGVSVSPLSSSLVQGSSPCRSQHL